MAQEADLDLVEVAPESKPPVAKIMDYGKFKYEAAQKAKEARRNQANTILKEVRFRLKIDDHDYETKRKRAIGFLGQGDKVKAMILFRGREQSRPEQGVRLLQRFAEDVSEFGTVEHTPLIDGRNMVMVIGPLKSKTDAKAEQNAKRNAAKEAARGARVGDSGSAQAKAPVTKAPVQAAPVETAPVTSPVDTSTSSAQWLVETAPVETKPAAKAPAAKTAVKAPAAKAPAAKAPADTKPAAAKAPAAKAAAKPAATKPAAKAPAKPKTEKPAE
jgi:translation initiation factor IF-3